MEDNLKSTLKIRGGVTPYGTVALSGDSKVTIFYLIQSFFKEKKVTLQNVPRSGIVLDFIEIVKQLGVTVFWENETTISVNIPGEISTDLTSPNISYKFAQILIPAILFRKGECYVPLTFRKEAKFYRELGFDIEPDNASILIRRNFINRNEDLIQISVLDENLYLAASRIFSAYFTQNLAVTYDVNDYRLKNIQQLDQSDIIKVPYNQFEFNLFVAMASLASAEVIIENFDLSQSLQFLMLFDEMAGNYEVMDGRLKIWRHQKEVDDLYEFLTLGCDALGYLFLMLSLIAEKPVTILCKNVEELSSIVTELNIMGCKISYADGTENVAVTVRPINNLSSVKSEIVDAEWGGVLIFGAVASRGYSRITNFNTLAYRTQYLMDNLTSLNLDISL
jgi:UDP-N-acetylglucosamine enolpyruvyl transferase